MIKYGQTTTHCDNCTQPANPHIHAIVRGTEVNVCSGACIGRLLDIWEPTSNIRRIVRRIVRTLTR